ncbi:hypothetical protein [Mycobacterium sp. AZCC_0083]|uniref:hypothetical protein n=1 Tax=Mycobacterium sp. AZCC_0083 TaxID=2735882 RepID=UPI00160EA955|nr:hypothetical protein [Mycobacterium sp. AZCC_0083]MBB5161582.1 hypothetical protein [Mycobacterium sp. AZCC_0083]
MFFANEFGQGKRGSLREALEWAEVLEEAVGRWANFGGSDEDRRAVGDQEPGQHWIGTGVASRSGSPDPLRDEWTAVVIVEHLRVLRTPKGRRFKQLAGAFMKAHSASFSTLVVGSVLVAADAAVVGGSVSVPGGPGGTLGGTLAAGSGRTAVTAGHIVWSGLRGGIAEQSAPSIGVSQREIGHVIGWSHIRRKHNKSDLGLIDLHPQCDDGTRTGFREVDPDDLAGLRVRKTGSRTETTFGHVTLIRTKGIGVSYHGKRRLFDGLFAVEGEQEKFAWYGDSGALIYPGETPSDGDVAIGMITAVSMTSRGSGKPVCWAAGSTALSDTMKEILQGSGRSKA